LDDEAQRVETKRDKLKWRRFC